MVAKAREARRENTVGVETAELEEVTVTTSAAELDAKANWAWEKARTR